MEQVELNATLRQVSGKKVKQLRAEGTIPGVLYGKLLAEPLALQFNQRELELAAQKAGLSTLVRVNVAGGNSYPALFREVQIHPVRRTIRHVDLMVVDLNEAIRVPVPLVLKGESPAEKLGALVTQVLDEVEVECLPADLVPAIEVDVTGLTEVGQRITLGDLTLPAGLKLMADPEEIIVIVEAVTEEEVSTEAPETREVEVVRKPKKEEVEE